MSALESGVAAPEIRLPLLDGREFSLRDALKTGPVVLAFYKGSCPVCQFTFPYLERIYKAYGQSGKFTLAGVSQDKPADTQAFNRQYGISFPTLLDDTRKYPVSNAYGLTNVPSIFMISTAGEVEFSSVGWSKADTEELNRRLAKLSGASPAQIFSPGEKIPDYKPG